MNINKPFAEVIESSLDSFLAQCWQWNNFPKFGSLVQTTNDQTTILGCVTHVQTGSMDPMRYPFPYQKTEKELLAEQPQIFEFLKTTFQIKVIGYTSPFVLSVSRSSKSAGKCIEGNECSSIHYHLPSYPSKIHSFVQSCSPQLAEKFFSKPDFLYLLFASSSQMPHFDDLLLAIFNQLGKNKKLSPETFDLFYQTLSLLTGNDYRRMKLFLKRMES